MTLRRVRTNTTIQDRPHRPKLGGFGNFGIPMDDGCVYGVWGFRNCYISMNDGLCLYLCKGMGPGRLLYMGKGLSIKSIMYRDVR